MSDIQKVEDIVLIQDAIDHLDELLNDSERWEGCAECRKDHVQLREWLTEFQKLKQLRQQGRLVELPCAVNDILYTLVSTESGGIIKKMQVKEIKLKHHPLGDSVFMLEQVGRRGLLFKCYESDFDKAVFHTHEEAEAALMERKVQDDQDTM